MTEMGPKETKNKARFDLIPAYPLWELAKVFTMGGGNKYPERSWEKGIKWGELFGALLRHAFKWWGVKETKDHESKCHPLAHVAWACFVLMEYERTGKGVDSRSELNWDPEGYNLLYHGPTSSEFNPEQTDPADWGGDLGPETQRYCSNHNCRASVTTEKHCPECGALTAG